MRRRILLTCLAVLPLAACSGESAPDPVELPPGPPGVEHLDDADLEAQLGSLQEALREVSGSSVAWEAVYDVTDGGAEELIAHYDEALTADGWEEATTAPDITGSLGTSWWRDGQSVVLLTVADLEGRDLAILIPPVQEES